MNYGQRLKAARKHKGLSQEELANLSGVKQGSISKIERGDQEYSAHDVALSKALDVHPFWLSDNDQRYAPSWLAINSDNDDYIEGEINRPVLPNPESNAHPAMLLGRYKHVPVVGIAQLGDNGHWTEMEFPVGFGDGYIAFPSVDDNAYALRCTGDSMRPRIKDGEFVIVEPGRVPIPGDEVLLKSLDGRVMVKTFLYIRDKRVHVMSINEAHPPQSFGMDEIDKIHPVAAIVKNALWVKE